MSTGETGSKQACAVTAGTEMIGHLRLTESGSISLIFAVTRMKLTYARRPVSSPRGSETPVSN